MATRRERVVLELEDRFTTGMARAAASSAVLNKELNSLSRDSVRTRRSMSDIDSAAVKMGRNSERAGAQVDKLSGRLRIFADVAAILGPSLIPIGAVAIPAVTGLAAQLGFATVAAGTTVLAFQGMGDALGALDKAGLEPTVENLRAAEIAMEGLTPAARDFASAIRELIPEARGLQDAASEGFFPGALEGLNELETILPRLEGIISSIATELGDITADAGASLASDRWAPFLDFIGAEAPQALAEMAAIVGNTTHAMAELWMAFDPVNDDFSQWLVDVTADLDRWSQGLAQTDGFREFVDYIQETGPQVADTFGAIGSAIVQLVQATSPLGGPVLAGVEALADAVSTIANSDLGTPLVTAVTAMALLNRSVALFNATQSGISRFGLRMDAAGVKASSFGVRLRQVRADMALLATQAQVAGARTERELLRMNTAAARLKTNLLPIARTGAVLGAVAIAGTGAADGVGLTNTATLALAGSLAGGPGIAAGGLIGLLLDAKSAGREFGDSMRAADAAIETGNIDELTAALERLKKERQDIANTSGFGDFFADVGRQITNPLSTLGFERSLGEQNEAKQRQLELNIEIERTQSIAEVSAGFLKGGFKASAEGIDAATTSVKDLQTELVKIEEILAGRASFRGFEQSIDDFAARQKKRLELQAELADAVKRSQGGNDLTANERNRLAKLQQRVGDADNPKERKAALADLRAFEATQSEQAAAERARALEDIKRIREEQLLYKNTLDTTTEAGRKNQEAIDAIAGSALEYANTIKDPVLRTAFLDNARDEFVKAQIAAGGSREAAEDLATELGLIDGIKSRVEIVVDADGVIHVIDVVEERLRNLRNALERDLSEQRVSNKGGGRDGRGFAGGGWTGPGSKYQPAGVVHADEFVFSKEATHGNVGLLNDMHRRLRGYANGGLVKPFPASVTNNYGGGVAIDYRQLARAVAEVRPNGQLYGDVHVSGDANAFMRQLERDRRMASVDGIQR